MEPRHATIIWTKRRRETHLRAREEIVMSGRRATRYANYISQSGKAGLREYPNHLATPALMQQWIEKCNSAFQKNKSKDEVCAVYAELHLALVTIHPFFDGNGRMARLVANLPVLKAGYPPIIIPKEDRKRYLETISAYQESIHNLSGLKDLSALPAFDGFCSLCAGYWADTMCLVEAAQKFQDSQAKPEVREVRDAVPRFHGKDSG